MGSIHSKRAFVFIRIKAFESSGSMTVEAALVFPLFILVWIPLLYLIRYCIVYEVVTDMAYQAAEIVGEAGYLYDRAALKEIQDEAWRNNEYGASEDRELFFTKLFGEQMEENVSLLSGALQYCLRVLEQTEDPAAALKGEGWKMAVNLTGSLLISSLLQSMNDSSQWKRWGISEINCMYSELFYAENGGEDLIRVVLEVPLNWPDPFHLFENKHLVVSAVTRGFIGIEGKTTINSEESALEEEKEETTYYRIGNGKKAHLHSCYLIEKDLHQIPRQTALDRGYTACGSCNPQGAFVWITSGGEKYHEYGCVHLFPSLTPISEEELRSGLYTPCAICIGGGEWFSH